MTNKKLYVDVANNVSDLIDLSDEEQLQFDKNAEIWEQQEEQKVLEAEAKEAQRQAILDRLGLTADEAKLILG